MSFPKYNDCSLLKTDLAQDNKICFQVQFVRKSAILDGSFKTFKSFFFIKVLNNAYFILTLDV